MSENNNTRLKKVKNNFDKITSENATNWKLVLIWIIVFEFVATIVEYLFLDKVSTFSVPIPHTLTSELIVASIVTIFVWFCIYNIIFENKRNIFRLAFFSLIGLYFIVTSDFTLQFLLQNLNPVHFFDLEFGMVFFIELFLKLVITYLFYQLVVSLINRISPQT